MGLIACSRTPSMLGGQIARWLWPLWPQWKMWGRLVSWSARANFAAWGQPIAESFLPLEKVRNGVSCATWWRRYQSSSNHEKAGVTPSSKRMFQARSP